MKYIKSINELMSFVKEKEELEKVAKEHYLVYKKKIDDCLLYISDEFNVKLLEFANSPNIGGTFIYLIRGIKTNEEKLSFLESLKSSNEKLEFELNAETQIRVNKNHLGTPICNFGCWLDSSGFEYLEAQLMGEQYFLRNGEELIIKLSIK